MKFVIVSTGRKLYKFPGHNYFFLMRDTQQEKQKNTVKIVTKEEATFSISRLKALNEIIAIRRKLCINMSNF